MERPRFWSRKIACQVCHFAKARCDGGRPCNRCVRLSHTPHCIDRPSRQGSRAPRTSQGKRQRLTGEDEEVDELSGEGETQLVVRPPTHALRLPFTATYLGMDGELVSRSMLASAHRGQAKLKRLGPSFLPPPLRKLTLRDKLMAWTYQHAMMTAEDAEEFIHSFFAGQKDWPLHMFEGHHSSLMTEAVSALIGRRSAADHGGWVNHSSGKRRHRQGCDGTACYGYCPWMETLAASAQCAYSWQRSPLVAVSDALNAPNLPFLVIQRLYDDGVTRRQEKEVEEVSLRVAAQLLASRCSQQLTLLSAFQPQYNADPSTAVPHEVEVDTAQGLRLLSPLPSSESDGWGSSTASLPFSGLSPFVPASIEAVASVQVNAAFERLLEWRQEELRQLFVDEGEKAFYRLFREDAWPQLMDLDAEVRWARRAEYRVYGTCRTRRQAELPCVLHAVNRFDDEGRLCVTLLSFMPLPDDSSGV